jgi:hypothetical protein
MSLKTLTEEFGKADEKLTSPFDFENEVTILAVPETALPDLSAKAEKPEGVTLNMPPVPTTKQVEVVEAPETFKGDLPHLTPEEHQVVIDWFDKQSCDPNNPLEVRTYLTEIALGLKLDAKKRIVPTEIDGKAAGEQNG